MRHRLQVHTSPHSGASRSAPAHALSSRRQAVSPLAGFLPSLAGDRLRTPPLTTERACECGGCATCANQRADRGRVAAPSLFADQSDVLTAPPSVDEVLRTPGEPLEAAEQRFMESRLGHDFGRVRVHSDARAAESARAVGAVAFTAGPHIVFGSDRYPPRSARDHGVLAHELVHVVQQRQVGPRFPGPLRLGSPGDVLEHEADRVTTGVVGPWNITHRAVASVVQRQMEVGGGEQAAAPDDDRQKYECLAALMEKENWRYELVIGKYTDASASLETLNDISLSLREQLGNQVFADCLCCGEVVAVQAKEAAPGIHSTKEFLNPPPPDVQGSPETDPDVVGLGERAVNAQGGQYFIEIFVKMRWGRTAHCGCT
jgi:uncharacterized protein DUF4157